MEVAVEPKSSFPKTRRAARRIAAGVNRAFAAALASGPLFGGLAFLRMTHPMAGQKLSVDPGAEAYALATALWCQVVVLVVALATEALLWLFESDDGRGPGASWIACVVWGFIGAFLFFPQPEHGPKEAMLVAGGALAMVLASGLFLWLWTLWKPAGDPSHGFAPVWYALVLLVGAAFLGGMYGWTSPSPYERLVLDYRDERWGPDVPAPRLPPPAESPAL